MLKNWKNSSLFFYLCFAAFYLIIQFASGNLVSSFHVECWTSDAESYTESAKIMLKGSYPWFRAVGYPLLLMPFIAIMHLKVVIIVFTILQALLWLFTLRLIYFILLKLQLSTLWAWIGAILYAVCLSPLLTTSHLLTETIYTFLLIWALYILLLWLKNRNYQQAGAIILLMAISALIRPLGLNFWYLSLIVFIPLNIYKKQFKILFYAAISIALIGGHLFMMKKHHNTNQLCLSKNHALYHYLYMKVSHYPNMNASSYEPDFFTQSALLDSAIINQTHFLSYRDSIYASKNKKLFNSNKYATLKTMYVNFKDEIYSGYSNNDCVAVWIVPLTTFQHAAILVLLLLITFGWLLLFIKEKFSIDTLFLGVLLMISMYICLGSSLVFWYGDRLHLPFYPLVIIGSLELIHRFFKPKMTDG